MGLVHPAPLLGPKKCVWIQLIPLSWEAAIKKKKIIWGFKTQTIGSRDAKMITDEPFV